MKQDRFLIAILIGIGVLVLSALTLFFVRQSRVNYLPADTPENVLHNYVLALERGDYERAYKYLAVKENQPTLEQFRMAFLTNQLNLSSVSMQIGAVNTSGSESIVTINLVHVNRGPFADTYRQPDSARLDNVAGEWKIVYLPYPYFNWDWYQTPQPVK